MKRRSTRTHRSPSPRNKFLRTLLDLLRGQDDSLSRSLRCKRLTMESLERRELMTVSAQFVPGTGVLSVFINSDSITDPGGQQETVRLASDALGNRVRILNSQSTPLIVFGTDASPVTSVIVTMSGTNPVNAGLGGLLDLNPASPGADAGPGNPFGTFNEPIVVNGGNDADTIIARPINQMTINSGAGNDSIQLSGTGPTGTNTVVVDGGADDDTFVLGNGLSLNGGTIDGGAGVDTIDYSAFTTPVQVNLGLQNNLTASLDGGQENPPVSTAANATATISYNALTRQATVSMTVNSLVNTITDFHIHSAPIGVNGPVIVPIGAGVFVPAGPGQYTANFVSNIPAANEAAFLGGLTYFNIHTNTFPGGEIRGQIQPGVNISIGSGTATGTAGISNIENATGGSGNDSLVGNSAANSLNGNAGNDVIVGGPGSDTFLGGSNNDTMVWNPGDGTDIMDGQADTDTVQLNGGNGVEVFAISPNGTRVSFARTSPAPFNLDVGTTEVLRLNANGGDDTVSVGNLAGVADLTTVNLFGQDGNDTFNLPTFPVAAVTVNVVGGTHTTGDHLNVEADAPVIDNGSSLTKTGGGQVNYRQTESLIIKTPGNVFVAGTAGDDNLVVNATGPNVGTLSLNGGPAVGFTGLINFRFDAGTGSDVLTINNPAGGLFAPTGGIDYNGGGNPGDALNLLGGGGAGISQSYFVGTTTPPIGPGPGNNGDGLIRFTGTSAVDIRFTGLAPIVDNVVAASLTVFATDASNNISVTNGVAPRLVVAVDAFEPIEFNNKTALFINAGDGIAGGDLADNVLLNFTNLPAGLTSVTINADEGADTVSLQASSNVPVTLNGGDGLDIINVGNNGTLGTPGLLTPVVGPVVVNGGAGGANLTVDGTGAAVAADYAITATTVTRSLPAGFGGVTYSNLNSLLLATGSGPNVVTVSSTSVPTTVDANLGIDTLIVTTPNAISVYEQAGNYGFELGTPGGLTAIDFENINVQPGNGVLNIVGDEGQGTNVGGAGVNDTDVVEVAGTAPGAGGLRLNNIAAPPVVRFTGVTNLNVNTFDLDDDVTLDPFATTTQSWDIVVNVNSGGGDDDIIYGNVNAFPALGLIANGSAAGVSENVTVTPTLVIGAGEIGVPGVVTIHFQETEDLSFLLNDGSAGDTDTLTVRGLDSNLPDSFTIRPDAAGNDAEPVVDIDTNAVQLLQIENIAAVAPGGAQFFVTGINFEGLAGDDTFNVLPSTSGTIVNIDGGASSFNPLSIDRVIIDAPANPANQVSIQAGATNDSGSIIANLAGAPRAAVNFLGVEAVAVNNSGTATIIGNNANNAITVIGTAASALTANVDGGPTLGLNGVTSLQVNALAGDDTISLTTGPLAIASITVNGGDPTASDTLIISGTAGIDTVAFTPTSPASGSLTGLATPVNFGTIEHVVYDGNDIAALDAVTINGTITSDTFTFDANSLQGNFRSFASPDFDVVRSARIAVNGGAGGGDVVNLLGSANADAVTSAANAITINTTGPLAIITLGAGIGAVTLSTLAGNDNVDLSGITMAATVFGGDGNDTVVGSPQADLIYGGSGDDVIVGGLGADVAYGEAGNDRFGDPAIADPAANDGGSDQYFGGDGSDTLTWDPGDGSDLFEGGTGSDVMIFNGSAGSEVFTLNAVGSRLEFLRSVGAIDMDLADVEQINLNANGAVDTVNVNDLFSTAVQVINLNLGTDGANDSVNIQGRPVTDNMMLTSPGANQLLLSGLQYNVGITGAEATDTLSLNGNDGDDTITAGPGTEAVSVITINGGNGNDLLTGNVAAINGGDGNDTLIGGAGNQTMDGGDGDDTFVGNGGTDRIGGGGGASVGDTIRLTGTAGADTFTLALSPTGQLIATINGLTTTYANFLGGPIVASGIEQILVQGLAGNDGLTVDSSNGAIAIPINFDGGDNADALTLTGGVATADTYQIGPSVTEGTCTIVIDGVTQVVRFNALEPVLDLVAGPLVVVGTNANNAINYSQGSVAANGLVSIDGFETIEFSNKTILTINALSGDDTINLNNASTPTGLTTINVNGGDPTANDALVVNGTTGNDTINYSVSNTIGAGSVAITGAPVVNFTTTESLHIHGQGGTDALTVTSPSGHRTTVTPGSAADSGSIGSQAFGAGTASVPLTYSHIGALGTVTLAGVGDIVEFNGTANSDFFALTGTTVQITNATFGFVTNLFNLTNVFGVELRGHDGDDTFNVTGTLAPYIGGVVVDGGNPSASDVLNLNAPTAAVVVDLASETVSGYGSQVAMIGVETLNANAGTGNFTVNGSSGDDSLEVTPTDLNSATFRLTEANPSVGSTPVVNGSNIGTLNVDLLGGSDTLVVKGTTAGEAITVTGVLVTIGALETVNFLGAEALSVLAQQGADTITVTPGAIPTFIDGGDPIGTGDSLTVNAAVGFFAGPENDEGGVLTDGGTVSFDHIESLTVAGIADCPFLILGTNADDDITVIAIDASTNAGADGDKDFTFSVNASMNVVLLNQPLLFIDAMAGDDDIVIRAAAPNDVPWDVDVFLAGGSPATGAPAEADRLVLETPNRNLNDNLVFTPTGADTGLLIVDENDNGSYDPAGTDSRITIGSFNFVCGAFVYPSTLGGVELIQYNGEGAPGNDDDITINGTGSDDSTVVNPTEIGTGTFRSGASPMFDFRSFNNLVVAQGTVGGFDSVEINGTIGPDTVTSDNNTVTLVGRVTLGAGIDQLDINTFDGNDNVDLDLQLTGLKKVVRLGEGNDIANLAGVLVDPADPVIYGGDGDDNIVGSPNVDFIYGGNGTDVISGLADIDYIDGGDGNDTITGGAGNDVLHGGAGSDTIIWNNGDNTDVVEGGTGDDRAVVNGAGAGDTFTIFADATNPTRLAFNRTNLIPFTLDIAEVEELDVNSGTGTDSITVGDLTTTALRDVDLDLGIEAGIADTVVINGRSVADKIQITGATSVMTIAGLKYDVRISNAVATDNDDFTFNASSGDDEVVAADSVVPFFASTDALATNRFRILGGDGNDQLSGYGALDGQAGDDTLIGSSTIAAISGNQLITGGAGDDTMLGGTGNDTFDGGTGIDTILVRGTPGNDAIDINQTAATTLAETVNLALETDTLVLLAGVRTVERVNVLAGDGNDTIRVQWADSLGTDAAVNSLTVNVDGGAGATGDRLGVVDLGTGDLILMEQGNTSDAGAMSIGPGNAESLIVTYSNIETAQPIVGNDGDVVVFKHDGFEYNNIRTAATYLGANSSINVDPTINPGLDPAFNLPADEDWYRVVAEKTGMLDFQVYFRQVATVPSGRPGLPNAGNLDIAVTDAAGNVITGFGANDATNDERIRIPAVQGQTYFLRVFANGNALNVYNITVMNYAPPVPTDMELLDNPVGDGNNSDTGRSQFDNVTRDNTPTLVFRLDDGIFLNDLPGNGGAGTPPDEVIPIPFQAAAGVPGYRIAIFDEGSSPPPGNQVGPAPQTPLGFATFVSPGVYQFTTPVLSDGSHFLTARVQMVDPATPQQTGFGSRSVALEVIVDTVVPPAFFGNSVSAVDGLHKDSDSGIATVLTSFTDRITNDTTPTMYGSAEANAIIRLFVDRTGNGFTADDIQLGQTVARPLDGSNQALGEWDITATTGLNSPDLLAGLGIVKDGVRTLFITAEDLAGNVSPAQTLTIMLDTTPPIISQVNLPDGDSVFQTKPTPTPTPRVDFITVEFTGGPASAGGFTLFATDPGLATNVRNYQVVGDHNGNVLITSAAVVSQTATSVVIRLNFAKPLPDDRFTLTIDDSISDAANNALDGESQAQSPGLAGAVLPSGNGINGGDFVARFTVDSRPEVGSVADGVIYVDINGNFVWDPQGKDNDTTNKDLVFQFGQVADAHFAGNFAPTGAVAASGYDKLGSYGRFAGKYSFALDTNDDGVGDFVSVMPIEYQVNGIPVAGDFNPVHPGDEIGLFDGQFWYLDFDGDNTIEFGERISSNFNGIPIVGDFNGDGNDDLATFNNATNTFVFDVNRDGNSDHTWVVADDIGRFVGLSGFTDRPVAGDLNLDGIDDIGIWVKDRQGTLPESSGEYFFWLSDRVNANPANVFDAFSPDPLGNDLFAEFGDEFALPIFGNFDPPTATVVQTNLLHNKLSPMDVDQDGFITSLDVLSSINALNRNPSLPTNDSLRAFFMVGQRKVDVNNDRSLSALDILPIVNFLNRRNRGGAAEGEGLDASLAEGLNSSVDSVDQVFAEMAIELDEIASKKRRR